MCNNVSACYNICFRSQLKYWFSPTLIHFLLPPTPQVIIILKFVCMCMCVISIHVFIFFLYIYLFIKHFYFKTHKIVSFIHSFCNISHSILCLLMSAATLYLVHMREKFSKGDHLVLFSY